MVPVSCERNVLAVLSITPSARHSSVARVGYHGHTSRSKYCYRRLAALGAGLGLYDPRPSAADAQAEPETETQLEAAAHAQIQAEFQAQVALEAAAAHAQEMLKPIWPGRIEMIYARYVASKTAYLAANPGVRPSGYRMAAKGTAQVRSTP
jgi:hypothetical protein